MRRAEWRRQADDPKSLLGWWWRGIAAHEWPFHLFVSVTLGSAIVTRIVWLAGVGIVATLASIAIRVLRTADRLAPMLPDPAPEGQFRAKVEYRRRGVTTGHDEMALCVVDGWLIGEGVRSSFALRSADVRAPEGWREKLDDQVRLILTDGSEIRLRGPIENKIAPRATIERWRRSQPPDGEPTFPPARVDSAELARWSAWWPLGIAVAWLPNLISVLLKIGHPMAGPFLTTFVLGSGMSVFGEAHTRRLRSMDAKARRDEKALLEGVAPHAGWKTRETSAYDDALRVPRVETDGSCGRNVYRRGPS